MIRFSIFLTLNNKSMGFNSLQVLKYPILTDKTTKLLEKNKYSFKVDLSANKASIKNSVETLFAVTVLNVNTCHLPKKKKTGWQVYRI